MIHLTTKSEKEDQENQEEYESDLILNSIPSSMNPIDPTIDIIEIERRLDDLFDEETLNIELIARNTHTVSRNSKTSFNVIFFPLYPMYGYF